MLLIWTQNKTYISISILKQIKTYKKIIKQIKNEETKLEHLSQHKNSLELDLTVTLNQSNQQQSQ